MRVVVRLGVVVGGLLLLAVAGRGWAVVHGFAVAVTRGPSGAPVRLATGAAAAAGGDAGAEDKEKEGGYDDDDEDEPADPVVPGRGVAVLVTVRISIAISLR